MFSELGLSEPILRAVVSEGYATPTPIQQKAIPHVLAGRDLFGCAQTGTGKTAAFALPILHRLHAARPANGAGRRIRTLVLSPTRELASQIAESFSAYGRNTPLRNTVIFGGVNQFSQVKALRNGVDIVVATPGRLLDLMEQGHVDLRGVEVFVLDEADRMLDLGFFPDIRKIVARLPVQRQTLLFSATMPDDIRSLAETILRDPLNVHVAPVSCAADRIDQAVYHVAKRNKSTLLRHLLKESAVARSLVFTRTKRGADRVVKDLLAHGIRAAAIHGNKSQANREKALDSFRANRLPVLVATDIAARGIDVDGISHVFNYDLPDVAETYVHRIGRTARAGASGIAFTFCDPEERGDLRAIERLLHRSLEVRTDGPETFAPTAESLPASSAAGTSRPPSSGNRFHPPRSRGSSGDRTPRSGGAGRRPAAGRPGGAGNSATAGPAYSSGEPRQNSGGSGRRTRGRRRRRPASSSRP
ncbi:MAG: DEAD/DEAH box helicase [Planctomycetales bacterium]